MKKKAILAGQKKLLLEIAALREENLELRRRLAALPETVPEPPVPDDPEEEITPQHRFSRFPLLRSVDERYPGGRLAAAQEGDSTLAALAAHMWGYAAAHYGLCAPPDVYASLLAAMSLSNCVALHDEAGGNEAGGNEADGKEAGGNEAGGAKTGGDETGNPKAGHLKASHLKAGHLKAELLLQAAAASVGQEAQLIPACRPPLGSQDTATKLYRETRLLRVLYEAGYQSAPWFAVLEGAPLSAITQAAERGPALRLVGDAWPGDPALLREGVLEYPENLWIFCMGACAAQVPVGLHIHMENAKEDAKTEIPCAPEPLALSAGWLRGLFARAPMAYPVPADIQALFTRTAAYLADRLDVSVDARTERQMPQFISVCLACGLRPPEALDAFYYQRALRRLENADPHLLRYELPGFGRFLDETFGKSAMPLTRAFTNNLQKND